MRIRVLINGTDLTNWIGDYRWFIQTSDQDDIDVLNMYFLDPLYIGEVYDPINDVYLHMTGRLPIRRGDDIIIESFNDNTIRYFGGIIAEKTQKEDGLGNITKITAQDWKVLLDKSSVTKKYTLKTHKQIIRDAVAESGITEIDTSLLVDDLARDRVVDYIEFAGHSLRSILVTISELTNHKWWIDPFKRIHFELEGTEGDRAAFGLSDNPDNNFTFPYYNTEYVEELGNFNQVELRGGYRTSDNLVEEFSGDGLQTIWQVGVHENSSNDVSEPISVEPTREYIDAIDPSLVDRVIIEKNTGSDGAPRWQTVDVALDLTGGGEATWNPLYSRVEWHVAPRNLTKSWRIHGRRNMPLITEYPAIPPIGERVYKHTIFDASIVTEEMGLEKAQALLRENGHKERLHCSIQKEGLYTGQSIVVNCRRYGLVNKSLKVHGMRISLLGGTVGEFRLTLGSGSHTLAHMLYAMRKGRELPVQAETATKSLVLTNRTGFRLSYNSYIFVQDQSAFLRGADETPVFSKELSSDLDYLIQLDATYGHTIDGDRPIGDMFPPSNNHARGSYSVAIENQSVIRS